MEYIDLSNAREIYYGGVAVSQVYIGNKLIYPSYFTIESISSGNTISLTYVNGLDDTTGYPLQIEADIWVDNAVSASTVVIPMNVTTTLATLDDGHKMRVYIHNHNLQNSFDNNVYINFGSTEEFKAYGTISSLLEDNKTSSRWVGLFRESKVADISNLVLPNDVKSNDYRTFCYMCDSLTTAPKLPATTLATNCYSFMFNGCTSLTTAPELPATTLAVNCYYGMFINCTSLTAAPDLPATTLNNTCYTYMFSGCTSLTTVPVDLLPATTLVSDCYAYMFSGCTSLTNVPNLPATTLAERCYNRMFYGCTSLTTVPSDLLPATTLANGCYSYMFHSCYKLQNVPELPATTLAETCYNQMFNSCRSLTTLPLDLLPATHVPAQAYNTMFYACYNLVNTPDLPITSLSGNYCCYRMFQACTKLTRAPHILPATSLSTNCYNAMFRGTAIVIAPVLPAITLATGCYQDMFRDCKSIRWIKALFTTTPSNSYTSNWLTAARNDADCTFVKNENATWTTVGNNGIPSNWVVQTCAADDYSYPE